MKLSHSWVTRLMQLRRHGFRLSSLWLAFLLGAHSTSPEEARIIGAFVGPASNEGDKAVENFAKEMKQLIRSRSFDSGTAIISFFMRIFADSESSKTSHCRVCKARNTQDPKRYPLFGSTGGTGRSNPTPVMVRYDNNFGTGMDREGDLRFMS